jgi:hypothetical protein
MALYFVFRDRAPRLAYCGLGAGVLAGLAFGLAQQSRGAHFISHDLWSVMLAWFISLTLYAFAFRCRLWGIRVDPKVPVTLGHSQMRISPPGDDGHASSPRAVVESQ